jgi:ABC-type branched-subunit amino acid transport system ATPase component
MLELDNVHAFYGQSHILHGVSLVVRRGEVVCLLGRNGAGKTTTVLTVMGICCHDRVASVTIIVTSSGCRPMRWRGSDLASSHRNAAYFQA